MIPRAALRHRTQHREPRMRGDDPALELLDVIYTM